jgi:predicted enzyme related to lactoylglutathione lyase
MLTREPKFVRLHFEVKRLHEMVARLRQSGLEAAKPPLRSPEGYERVVYQDPDGYEVCLFEWVTAGQL